MARIMVSRLMERSLLMPHLLRLPPLQYWRERAARGRRAAFVAPVPGDGRVLAALREHGICELGALAGGASVLAGLTSGLARDWAWQGDVCAFEAEAIVAHMPEVYRLGLDAALLDLAEAYLEEPCHYVACTLKREAVSEAQSGPRQWHLDVEAERIFRVIVYLNAVGPGGGPFQYVARPQSDHARKVLRYRSGYLSDARMAGVVPQADWASVLGAAGSVAVFDGAAIFHRVARPERADRYSLSFTYTSRHPVRVRRSVLLSVAARQALEDGLTARQYGCVPPGR